MQIIHTDRRGWLHISGGGFACNGWGCAPLAIKSSTLSRCGAAMWPQVRPMRGYATYPSGHFERAAWGSLPERLQQGRAGAEHGKSPCVQRAAQACVLQDADAIRTQSRAERVCPTWLGWAYCLLPSAKKLLCDLDRHPWPWPPILQTRN